MAAAQRLADRGFGKAIQALDIDVNQHSLEITHMSTPDLAAMAEIVRKYSPDAAELAESGELRLSASAVEASSRQR